MSVDARITFASLGLAAFLSTGATACSSTFENPPLLTQNRELATYGVLAGHPGARDIVVLTAASQYLAARREHDGLALFRRLAQRPERRPLFVSLEGLMKARVADDIALLDRVAWVEDAITLLDEGAMREPKLGRYLRGLVFAELPARFEKLDVAVSDLEASLRSAEDLPFAGRRGILRALATALEARGDHAGAEAMRRQGGITRDEGPALLADASVTSRDGFRFEAPQLVRAAEGVYLAEGFDFSTIAFLIDREGVVAIDAGTTEANARAAVRALRTVTTAPIRHVVFTHAHWDHIGGAAAVIEPGAEVWASVRFPADVVRIRDAHNPFREGFWGRDPIPLDVHVDHLVDHPEPLQLGALDLELRPAPSGETDDALFVRDRGHDLLFVGDAFMPYVGAPFAAEGSASGYIEAAREVQRLRPGRLIHGHPPLTRYWTVQAMPGLQAALESTRAHVALGVQDARPIADILADGFLPPSLRASPDAAMPFAVTRDTFEQRLHREIAGYWSADGTGIDEPTSAEWSVALDLLGGGSADAFEDAVTELVTRGDAAMALRVADLGLRSHPKSEKLRPLRARALAMLQARYQQVNPFRFIVYSAWTGRDVPPVSR